MGDVLKVPDRVRQAAKEALEAMNEAEEIVDIEPVSMFKPGNGPPVSVVSNLERRFPSLQIVTLRVVARAAPLSARWCARIQAE